MLSPNQCQLVFELDHSQAHKRHAENTHVIKNFNLNPGGEVPFVRDFIVGNDSLGKHAHDQKVSTDRVVMHKHLPTDLPPKGSEYMPKHDTIDEPKDLKKKL